MNKAIKLLEKVSDESFPSDEIWIRDDLSFFAYFTDLDEGVVYLTIGNILKGGKYGNSGHITFSTTEHDEDFIIGFLDSKEKEGYYCCSI
jgi:hypothetical protein